MSTEPYAAQAYVIESDGSKKAIPVSIVEHTASSSHAGGTRSHGFAQRNTRTSGFAPQSPFTTVDAATTAPRRSLHLGRRILGLGIAALGVPLLIFPGPGLMLIGIGVLMVVMP